MHFTCLELCFFHSEFFLSLSLSPSLLSIFKQQHNIVLHKTTTVTITMTTMNSRLKIHQPSRTLLCVCWIFFLSFFYFVCRSLLFTFVFRLFFIVFSVEFLISCSHRGSHFFFFIFFIFVFVCCCCCRSCCCCTASIFC